MLTDNLIQKYRDDGYVVFATGLPESVLEKAKKAKGPLQPDEYHWSDGPRVFEGWKSNRAVRQIAWCKEILEMIETLHSRAVPFQTINFSKGTNQKLHQDSIHFQTLPLGQMIGVWVALEDMDEDNGTLVVAPGSHKKGFIEWPYPAVEVGKQYRLYAAYEKMVDTDKTVPIVCKQGDAILWHPDLLHGGHPIKDESRTRYSQVTHYYTDKAKIGWAPMFSDPERYDFYFKSMRWFDWNGKLHEQWEKP